MKDAPRNPNANGISGWVIKGQHKVYSYSFREQKDDAITYFVKRRAREGSINNHRRLSPGEIDQIWADAMRNGFKAVPAAMMETAV